MATEPIRIQSPMKFGDDFELDLRAFELRRSGIVLKLEPTPFGILALLIEQRGDLVSRQQIVDRVWGKGVFLDTDNSINGAIRKIRQVLNDDSDNPRFIQTVTGRGYRFIAPVTEPVTELPALRIVEPVAAPAQAASGKRSLGFQRILVLLLVMTAAVACTVWLVARFRAAANASQPIRSLAVLPLDNLSGDPSQDYFADAMTDELITNLAKVGSLRVTSRTTVGFYKHTGKTLPEIARELNVDGIVEGSIVRSGQRVRVTAQLIRASADQHLWAETYERDLGDSLQLQSDVARAITQQVRAQLTPELKAQFSALRSVEPDAYDSYLKGRYYIYNESSSDPGTLSRAKAAFEAAIQKDPNFSAAYSGLAETYVCIALFAQGEMSAPDAFRLARQAARKALELDPNNGEAYDALGAVNWRADFDWKAADEAFTKSIALAPSFSCGHEDRAIFLAFMGRRDESLAELEKSKLIDPGPVSAGTALGVYIQLRDWPRLLDSSRRQLAENENDWLMHTNLGLGYEGTGMFPQAIAEYQRAVELSDGGDLNAVASLGHAYAVAGRRYDAEKILRDLEQKSREGKASPYLSATIYAGLGQDDKALSLIEKAYQEKSLDLGWTFKSDLRTDNLRSNPRFQDLLRRTGLLQ